MLNLMVVFTYSLLNWKRSILANSVQKIKSCLFKLKFRTKTDCNMLNLMMMFTFSLLNWKHSFCQIWSKKQKIVSLI